MAIRSDPVVSVCVDPHDIPVVAFVDPEMMSTMPKGLTAFTGMDALTHAIEGYITKGACPMTDMMHLEAIRLISANLRDAVANKPSGRAGMALGCLKPKRERVDLSLFLCPTAT